VVDVTTGTREDMTVILKKLLILTALIYVYSAIAEITDEERVKEVVKIYNHTVIEASKSKALPDIIRFKSMMSDITTGRVAEKLYIWIMSWHENNLYMDAKLLDIKFTNITLNEKTATAFTDERWIYKYIDASRGTIAHPETEVRYKMRYDLVQKNGRWLINKIKIISQTEEILKNKEGRK